jgi:hypothetical protein
MVSQGFEAAGVESVDEMAAAPAGPKLQPGRCSFWASAMDATCLISRPPMQLFYPRLKEAAPQNQI